MASFEIKSKINSVRLGEGPQGPEPEQSVIVTDVKLPTDAEARLKTLKAEGKKWYVTVAYHPDSELPFAIFCQTNHKEKSAQTHDAVERMISLARKAGILEEHIADLESKIEHDNNVTKLTRAISLLLRHRVAIKNIVHTLDQMDIFVGTFLFQIKKFLSQYVKDGEKADGAVCGDCGSTNMVFSEGCLMCKDCGSSKCS